VTLNDRKEFMAHIVGRDPKTNLAIAKIDAEKSLPAANIGDSNALMVGDAHSVGFRPDRPEREKI
jgi:serine protease Do